MPYGGYDGGWGKFQKLLEVGPYLWTRIYPAQPDWHEPHPVRIHLPLKKKREEWKDGSEDHYLYLCERLDTGEDEYIHYQRLREPMNEMEVIAWVSKT